MPPYAPRWGEDVTVEVCISPISPLHLRHISAISPPYLRQVCISADGGASYGACGATVTYFDPSVPPELVSISPEFVKADAWARTTLTLRGSNFAPTSALACHVATSASEAGSDASERAVARFVSWGEVECDAPQRGWHEDAYLSVTHDGTRWATPLPLTYFKTAVLQRTSPDAADLGGEGTQLTLDGANLFAREMGGGHSTVGGRYSTNLLCRLTPLRHPVPGTPPPAANFTTEDT